MPTIPDDEDQSELFDPAPGPAPEQYDLFTEVPTSQDAPGEAHKAACGGLHFQSRDRCFSAIVRGQFERSGHTDQLSATAR